MKNKIIIIFFCICVILSTISLSSYIKYNKEKEINSNNNKSIKTIKVAYNSIFNAHKITAKVQYYEILENTKVLNKLKDFKHAKNELEKNLIRNKLYNLLIKKYTKLKQLGIIQFHFHTNDGKSLLRFHKPIKYGDNIISIRKSIESANKKFKPYFGFESGRSFSGFRYVFPIIYEKEHLGSVEFSIPFEVIERELQAVLPKIKYQLHLNKAISYEKIFDSYKEEIKESNILNNYYIQANSIESKNKIKHINIIEKKLPSLIKKEQILKEEDFTINFIERNIPYRINFLSIKNANNIHEAYLTCYCNFEELLEINKRYFIFQFLLIAVSFIVLFLTSLLLKQINHIMKKNKNIQQLLDTQNNIVILTDGENLHFVNTKFFDFFNFKSLKDFKKYHKCICELFCENDKFFHLGKVKENENWLDRIQELPHSERIVSMLAKDFSLHAFSVTINKFDDDFMILTFTDISQTILNYIELEEKTIRDKLTGAFNREYFEQNYKNLLSDFNKDDFHFALAILDIDHFKLINDTYGHDIGDEVLIQFVKIVEKYSRKDDIFIRWGGEEFLLLLKVHSKKDLQKALEHIRKVIELQEFSKVGHKTCCLGGTMYKEREDIKETIKRADQAVYKAKEQGRNKVVIY